MKESPLHDFRDIKGEEIARQEGWVRRLNEFQYKVHSQRLNSEYEVSYCPSCNSEEIVKHGVRHNDSGDIQRWSCKVCGKWFTLNLGFEKMKATPQAITSAMQLYFTGESYRNVQKFLRLQGVNVSNVTIHSWVKKYVAVMGSYLDKLIPRVGDVWRTDELFLKVKGDMKYLFAMMDDDTRFWIAQGRCSGTRWRKLERNREF